jgi:hypothetical protein
MLAINLIVRIITLAIFTWSFFSNNLQLCIMVLNTHLENHWLIYYMGKIGYKVFKFDLLLLSSIIKKNKF